MYEFRFAGESQTRPDPEADTEVWDRYLYFRTNEAGVQQEWWYHRSGCQDWFLARRDTRTNVVIDVLRPGVASR